MEAVAESAIEATLTCLREAEPRLDRVIAEAQARTRALGRNVLASLSIELPAAPDPPLPATECFFWEQPSRSRRLLAFGAVDNVFGAGEGRFETLRAGIEQCLRDAMVEPAGCGLRVMAGFGFDTQALRGDEWRGFADAQAVLPEALLASEDGRHLLQLNCLGVDGLPASYLARDLVGRVQAWLSPRSEPSYADAASLPEAPESEETWDAAVRSLVGRIAAGEAEKVVLARRVRLPLASPDLDAALARLRARFPDCTLFALRRGDAVFLGATPETLVSLNGLQVRADCLAGSARRGATPAKDEALGAALLADEKERREHALVVRGLRQALAPVCASIEMPDAPALRRTAAVQHLHTPVSAVTDRRRHVLELVQRLHPTPATAGLPRAASLRLIREHEAFARGWYAGPLGWFDSEGDGEFAVALRSALVRGNEAVLYAGCGIVAGSDPAREYAEAETKLNAMRYALSPANGAQS